MQLEPNEKLVLQTLSAEARKGVSGYVNLAKKLAPGMSLDLIRETLTALEEKSLVRYLRTQDRTLLLGQITDLGLRETTSRKYVDYKNSFFKRINGVLRNWRGKNIMTGLAIALVLILGGAYWQSGSFQANFLATEKLSPEEVMALYGQENLNFGNENIEINFAGQLSQNYFYQVDTTQFHYLFTLQKNGESWKVTEAEVLHR